MFYRLIRMVVRFIMLCLGLKAEGMENIPSTGSVIIAANHVSNWDPVVVGVAMQRPVYFMAKESLFKYRLMGLICRGLHAFPVRRGVPDRNAIRHALGVLEQGKVLGLFPQGVRDKTGAMKAQSGVALIALKSGAPIVPTACIGTNHTVPCGWFKPLLVRFGQPIYLDQYKGQRVRSADMEQISAEIMCKISDLM